MFLRLFFSFLAFVLVLEAKDSQILSKTQRDLLKNEKEQNQKSGDILKFDWINPVTATYSHSKSDSTTPSSTTDSFSISLSQPIFRSGGIYYAIKYADANREFLRLSTSLKEKSLLKNAYTLYLSLKSLDLKMQKQKLLIKNADIDIKRKKEQYLSGVLDSSYLDNAILNKNRLQISLLDMQSQKVDLLKSFRLISSLDYNNVKLPHITLVKLDNFIKNNLVLQSAKSDIIQQNYLKNMTISNYLPKVTISASYNYNRTNYFDIRKDSYKRYGLSVSMPLFDINRGKNIELQKLKVIRKKLQLIDKKNSEKELYNSVMKKIELYKKKIILCEEENKLYNSLLKSTNDLYKAGEKTIYDVQTMQNSLKSTLLDKEIYKIEIDKLLFDLYEHLSR